MIKGLCDSLLQKELDLVLILLHFIASFPFYFLCLNFKKRKKNNKNQVSEAIKKLFFKFYLLFESSYLRFLFVQFIFMRHMRVAFKNSVVVSLVWRHCIATINVFFSGKKSFTKLLFSLIFFRVLLPFLGQITGSILLGCYCGL